MYWLLEEPLVHGARFDVTWEVTPGLLHCLINTRTLKLHHLFDVAGPGFNNAQSLTLHLGVRSVRQVETFLDIFKQKLTEVENNMLNDFMGKWFLIIQIPFQVLFIVPISKDCLGHFWT